MKKFFLLFLLIGLFPYVALGNNRYLYVLENVDGEKYYLDTQSVSYIESKQVAKFWLKNNISNKGRKRRIADVHNKNLKNLLNKTYEIQSYIEINFNQNSERVLQELYYSSEGNVLHTYSNTYFGDVDGWFPIPPNTIIEAVRDAVRRVIEYSYPNKQPSNPFLLSPYSLSEGVEQSKRNLEWNDYQDFMKWLKSQSDYLDFYEWYLGVVQDIGKTPSQVDEEIRYIGEKYGYSEVKRMVLGWYQRFHNEKLFREK